MTCDQYEAQRGHEDVCKCPGCGVYVVKGDGKRDWEIRRSAHWGHACWCGDYGPLGPKQVVALLMSVSIADSGPHHLKLEVMYYSTSGFVFQSSSGASREDARVTWKYRLGKTYIRCSLSVVARRQSPNLVAFPLIQRPVHPPSVEPLLALTQAAMPSPASAVTTLAGAS